MMDKPKERLVNMTELMAAPHRGWTLDEYVRILVKRRWAALAVFLCLVGTVALHSFTATPIYKATVQILIERQTPRLLEQPGVPVPYDYSGEEFYQTQYKLLESRALSKKVVDKLQLQKNPYYSEAFKNLPPTADEATKQRVEESLVATIAADVEVSPIRQSSLVNVSFSHPDPKFAAQLVNTLAQSYIEQSLELRFAASQVASAWLEEKLTEARKKLEESEAKLNHYKREHNIIALDDKESITAQKLEQLNKDLLTAQTHRMEAETRYKEVSQGRPISQVLNNPLIQTLKGQEAKIIAEHSELSRKYGAEHPRMIQLTNELAATRGKIGAEMSQVVQAIKNEYYMAQAQEQNLKTALEAQKVDTQDMSDRGIHYRVLLRDVETSRALYENVLKSLKTTTATENIPSTNIRIVYPATVPGGPVSPRKFFNLLVSSVLGLLLGAALALGLESMDTTLKSPEEVEGWLEIPNLAMIPHLEVPAGNPGETPELIVHHNTQPLASESYRGLRTSILFSAPGQAPRVLLVTSSLPMEGKTLTAANLATAMAKAEGKVLLVDTDLRRPTLHQLFQVSQKRGLSNFLVGEIDELPAVETKVPHLYLVPSGPIPPNPSELLGSARMREFLSRAQEQFGRVILDSAPLISVTDAAILSTQAEGVILVIKAEALPRKVAIEAKNLLLEVQAPLLGAVLNDVPIQRESYYYSYYHRYRSYYPTDDSEAPKKRRLAPQSLMPSGLIDRVKEIFHKRGKIFAKKEKERISQPGPDS